MSYDKVDLSPSIPGTFGEEDGDDAAGSQRDSEGGQNYKDEFVPCNMKKRCGAVLPIQRAPMM